MIWSANKRREQRLQEEIDREEAAQQAAVAPPAAPAAAGTAGTPSTPPPTPRPGRRRGAATDEESVRWQWPIWVRAIVGIALVLAAIAVIVSIVYTPEWNEKFSMADLLSHWSWNRWFLLLLLWGLLAGIVALVGGDTHVAKTIQWVLVGVVAGITVIAPFMTMHAVYAREAAAEAAVRPAPAKREPVVYTHVVDTAAGTDAESRRLQVPHGFHAVIEGKNACVICTYKDRSPYVFKIGEPGCPGGNMEEIYIRNLLSEKPNTATIKFVETL